MNVWFWATVAALVAILEIVAPGYYLIWIATGAAFTAIAVWLFGPPLVGQLFILGASSGFSCIVGYFVYKRLGIYESSQSELNNRGQSMVGARGVVCESFTNGRGKIRLGDSVWLAEGPNLQTGVPVEVIQMRSTVAVVRGMPRSDPSENVSEHPDKQPQADFRAAC